MPYDEDDPGHRKFEATEYTHRQFVEQAKQNYQWQQFVAEKLSGLGLKVELAPLKLREKPSTEHFEDDKGDLKVEGKSVEVKSTSFAFSAPADFPFDVPMVDTKYSFTNKKVRPAAYIVVSQVTRAMMWIPVAETMKSWSERISHDRVKQGDRTYLHCPRKFWHRMATFAPWISGGKVEPPAEEKRQETRVKEDFTRWDAEMASLVDWFNATSFPMKPFTMHPWAEVVDAEKFFGAIKGDVDAGPGGPRNRTGALKTELARLKELFP